MTDSLKRSDSKPGKRIKTTLNSKIILEKFM